MNKTEIEYWTTISPGVYAHAVRLQEVLGQAVQVCVLVARLIRAAYQAGRYDRREEIIRWCSDRGFGVVASSLRVQQIREQDKGRNDG